ncbi:hypothetical protein JOC54_001041 [Alkalihalobacillus xiaoxiensis]|uniref:Uncharacterized protein n=1 Tax=Shouchella xiaoxiensis TaxID=766895 RepID=A0ABS2SSN2_9BACI|nr:hypothetical protein [Shouchella xiaoxiensis]MBM7837810.1 hypothetical protein [Shouchella xiaoxiensis]
MTKKRTIILASITLIALMIVFVSQSQSSKASRLKEHLLALKTLLTRSYLITMTTKRFIFTTKMTHKSVVMKK